MSTKLKRLQYSRDDLNAALQQMENGMTVYAASKRFKVPRTTLLYKQRGVYALNAAIGHPTVLTTAEEDKIKGWIVYIAKTGFPATKDQLLDSVQLLLKNLKRQNNFKNGRPGRRWYEGFLKRNSDISERISQHLVRSRAIIRENNIRGWFHQINTYLVENNFLHITTNPKRIFNCDESAFLLAPKEKCVLVAKGERAVYNIINNDEKECLTTLIMVNAAGDIVPPMVVYKYKRIPFSLARKMPNGWGIGCSESGWMNGEIFYEYVANVFLPWLRQNGAEFPVILFLDGHVSHLSLALSEFCKEHQIILIALYPNATHLLQPLDVGIFRPLKVEWKKIVHSWKIENEGKKLRKEDFAPLLAKVLPTAANATSIQNAFRACGIYPFSAEAVNYFKLLKDPPPQALLATSTPRMDIGTRSETFLEKFESFLSGNQLQSFKDTRGTWLGIKEDESLYHMWVKITNKCSQQPHQLNFSEFNDANTSNINSINIGEVQQEVHGQETGEKILQNIDFNEVFRVYDNELSMNIDGVGEVITLSIENPKDIDENVHDPAENISKNIEVIESPKTEPKNDEPVLSNVETPFKNSFFWPGTKPNDDAKNKVKRRIPSVIVSSDEYINHKLKKQAEKDIENQNKLERKLKREAKRNSTSSAKNAKTEKPSPTENTLTNVSQLKAGNYVIVQYEEQHFPGVVLQTNQNEASVKVMGMSGPNWKWPEKDDILFYAMHDIIETIPEPELLNARGIYCVPEIQKYKS